MYSLGRLNSCSEKEVCVGRGGGGGNSHVVVTELSHIGRHTIARQQQKYCYNTLVRMGIALLLWLL